MGSVLGNPARELEAPIGTVNPWDCPLIIERFDIHSVPLFVLFVDGVPSPGWQMGSSVPTSRAPGSGDTPSSHQWGRAIASRMPM